MEGANQKAAKMECIIFMSSRAFCSWDNEKLWSKGTTNEPIQDKQIPQIEDPKNSKGIQKQYWRGDIPIVCSLQHPGGEKWKTHQEY